MSEQLWASSSWIFLRTFHSAPLRGQSSRKTTSAFAPARSASSMRLRKTSNSVSVKFDVLVINGEVVDAALGRCDPAGHLAGLDHAVHERLDEGPVGGRGDPLGEVLLVVLLRDHLARGV